MKKDQSLQEIIDSGLLGDRKIKYFDEIDSTNVAAAELGGQGCESGTIVIAQTQSSGKGRLGRPWQSPAGTGLYFSLVWHSKLAISELSKLTLAAGLGLCRAVEEFAGLAPLLKWPNDLLVNDKKVAGILTENIGQQKEHSLIIIGVGLNVNTPQTSFPEDLTAKASSLYLSSGMKYPLGGLFLSLIRNIEESLNELEARGFSRILAEWRQKDATIGREMTWVTPSKSLVTGKSIGVNDQGLLRIRDNHGEEHEVMSGDLNLCAKS